MKPADTADPRHYFRLLLLRLLETQQCLSHLTLPPAVQLQRQTNASTLSEIKSWLEEAGDNWEISPSPSSARFVVVSGAGLPSSPIREVGSPWDNPYARPAPPPDPEDSPAPSCPPSARVAPVYQRDTSGRITFRQPSSSGKPDCI
jgi:hypothetical protein